MKNIIAYVRLAPGQVGFYDELTRIHLTISNPQAAILAGMNTTNIKRSVRSGRLILVSGSLEPEAKLQKEADAGIKMAQPKVKPAVKEDDKIHEHDKKDKKDAKVEKPVLDTSVEKDKVVEQEDAKNKASEVKAEAPKNAAKAKKSARGEKLNGKDSKEEEKEPKEDDKGM